MHARARVCVCVGVMWRVHVCETHMAKKSLHVSLISPTTRSPHHLSTHTHTVADAGLADPPSCDVAFVFVDVAVAAAMAPPDTCEQVGWLVDGSVSWLVDR